jgi:hypothetical protein
MPEVSVVAGPGPVAHILNPDGSLVVYIGAGLAMAPDTAMRSSIEEGFNTWMMRWVEPQTSPTYEED